MKIEPFGVEQWMNKWETRCALNLAETCVASLTLAELMQMAGKTQAMPSEIAALHMTYGDITGSPRLRGLVAGLFQGQASENVMITHGTIGANHLVYAALVGPGDRVVAVTPTYQQHTAIPRSMGAEVVEVPLREALGWRVDMAELRAAAKGAVLIALTNPNNPTGAVLTPEEQAKIVEIARENGAWLLADEVYRGAETRGTSASFADLYDKGISTGSMSKAFSLAGLRLGWVVGPESLLHDVEIHRDYTTISVGQVDDYFAAMALENAEQILGRSRDLLARNRGILEAWVEANPGVAWSAPAGGTTALLRLPVDLPSYDLCEALIRDTGVMFTPGSVMGMEGHVRIGYGCETRVLEDGLKAVGDWLHKT